MTDECVFPRMEAADLCACSCECACDNRDEDGSCWDCGCSTDECEYISEDDYEYGPRDGDDGCEVQFADPGGRSALRAETRNNPRIHACPQCGRENMLTPADVARHYVCDACADRNEAGF